MTDFEQYGDKFYHNAEFIGEIHRTIQTATYVTSRSTALHWFRKYQGWAMGLEHLKALKAQGVTIIQVTIDNHRVVSADLDAWVKYGFTIQYQPYEAQKVLPEAYFRGVNKID